MSTCSYCGRQGRWDEDHLTGSDFDDVYLDPELTWPLCHDHHKLTEDDWYTLDIFKLDAELTLLDRVELRLRRLACKLARLDIAQGGGTIFGKLAAAFDAWAVEVRRFKDALDVHSPGWRRDRRFYLDADG